MKSYHSKRIISLTTDFSWLSEGIGIMKGIILEQAPDCQIIDLCHTISSYSTINGSRQFETILYLPVGIHLAIVDPEVGTHRKCLALSVHRGDILLGPDNGILMNAASVLGGIIESYVINTDTFHSTVFDGRDIFAKVAGLLASGNYNLSDIGYKIDPEKLKTSPLNDFLYLDEINNAKIIHINSFGNIVINIKSLQINNVINKFFKIQIENKSVISQVKENFASVPIGTFVITDDGYGRYSIAMNRGSAKEFFNAKIGNNVNIIMVRSI